MALQTFSGIKTEIANWARRTADTDFVAAVPSFIELCEARINRSLRVREQETSATITLTSGAGSLPSDYLEAISVSDGSSPPRVFTPMPKTYGVSEYGNSSGGVTDHYWTLNGTITTVPASDTNLTCLYYAKVPALSDGAPTNWLLTKAPGVYLYGALIEAAVYMEDDARGAVWGGLFDKELLELQQDSHKAKYARAVSRTRGDTP